MPSGPAAEEHRVILIALSKQVKFQQYLIWLGLALIVLIAAGLVIFWLRRRVLGSDARQADAGLFDQLRSMRDRGEMSVEEYDAAKAAMVARVSGKPPAPGAKAGSSDRIAKPGFDLTGAPLPPSKPPNV
jgi:hypothetical protein